MAARTSGKSAAAVAAKTLLTERIALVEALGSAIDAHQQALAAVTAAETAASEAASKVHAAFDAAKAGGWTANELHHVGLRTPAAPRNRHKSRAAETASSGVPDAPNGTDNGAAMTATT